MVGDQFGTHGVHQAEDRGADVGCDLVQEGLADEARQQDHIDAAHLQAADQGEGVQLAAGRVIAGIGAQAVAGEALLLESDSVTSGVAGGCADQMLEKVR